MSRIFIWLESSSCLNFVSERDPDEIVQTHMLSWAFADHICHKFQQGLYQVIWGSTQVDFMLGSELCSRKEHTHRLFHRRRQQAVCGKVPWIKMRWWPRVSSCRHVGKNIKYTVALFSALDVSVRKKNKRATCTIFSAFCTKPNDPLCCKRPRQSLYINLFYSLSPKWSSHFP